MRISASVESLLLAAREHGGDASITGRSIVTFQENATEAGVELLRAKAGMRVVSARDFDDQSFTPEDLGDADALVFPEIGSALLSIEAAQRISGGGPIYSIDPEHFVFANDAQPNDYLYGLLNMVEAIGQDLDGDEIDAAWGLRVCRVSKSAFSGEGVRVAVLDSGFDLGHPEFAGRRIVTSTFIDGHAMDLGGHGTHLAGTACGPKATTELMQRYGVAYQSDLFVAKVLTNSGAGTQSQMLAGMNWAVAKRCPVILLGSGGPALVQPSYTSAGAAALARGCLMIAPAGCSSSRPAVTAPAGAPANSPSVISVGALDASMGIALFSPAGKIDIAGPGVSVFSSAPRPGLHNTLTGTSMAAAHVAGCAALWAQTNPSLRGIDLRARLFTSARRLEFPTSDAGAGLVQAP